ncbi:MAG TPA: class I SAM-dependent methyltransferase [Caldilineaceae bacterium]|nr:class I SAM-dependent methyltransferase [Caldilineaceae bacterium]
MDSQFLAQLRTAYDAMVTEREGKILHSWKAAERARFLAMVQAEGKRTLLEIGMGTGRDSLYFQEQGITVTCADLSPAMVAHCRGKGLDAHVVDFASLDRHFAADTFPAIYAVNCLLHVPKTDLPLILQKIHTILAPDGLFYWGQYGGVDQEGAWEGDHYRPQRFFARYTDEQFRALPQSLLQTEAFCVIPNDRGSGHGSGNHFHSLILRKVG